MKNFYLYLILFLVPYINYGQIINFPDVNFKNKVIADGVDTNNDGEIQFTEAEAVTDLNVNSLASDPNKISDMTGIEFFTNLIELRCGGNEITTLDVTANANLELLYAYFNDLTSIDVTGLTSLTSLWVNGNALTSIDLSTLSSLWWIYCRDNLLTDLDVTNNTQLGAIWGGENQFSTIDLSNNPLLTELLLSDNQINTIDVDHLSDLQRLDLNNNNLTELEVSGLDDLYTLYLNDNDLLEIDCSLSGVGELHIENNPNLTNINVKNGVISTADPDLLYWGFRFANLPSLEVICMDAGEEFALSESGYDPNGVIVTTQPDCSLGVKDFDPGITFLYPNPVKDQFSIQSNLPVNQYMLFTTTGKLIFTSSNKEELDQTIPTLDAGMYFLHLYGDTSEVTLKFIKV